MKVSDIAVYFVRSDSVYMRPGMEYPDVNRTLVWQLFEKYIP